MGNLKKLQEIREQKGYSRQEMASTLEIGFYAYESYERGTRDPKLSILKKIAEILGCSIDDLI